MGEIRTWVLFDSVDLPAQWRARARPASIVPLLPSEVEELFEGEPARPAITEDELPLVRLLAEGRTAEGIARELRLSARTVHRRLAKLRAEFGLGTNDELSLFFAQRGFRSG